MRFLDFLEGGERERERGVEGKGGWVEEMAELHHHLRDMVIWISEICFGLDER